MKKTVEQIELERCLQQMMRSLLNYEVLRDKTNCDSLKQYLLALHNAIVGMNIQLNLCEDQQKKFNCGPNKENI